MNHVKFVVFMNYLSYNSTINLLYYLARSGKRIISIFAAVPNLDQPLCTKVSLAMAVKLPSILF